MGPLPRDPHTLQSPHNPSCGGFGMCGGCKKEPHMTKTNPRRNNGHRRNLILARVKAEENQCWICGQDVDKALPPWLPGSPEVDEVIPVAQGGNPLDRDNCRLSHRACNQGRNKKRPQQLKPLSNPRNW